MGHPNSTTATLPLNLQTRTTGTVHAPADGAPLCPARARTSAQGAAYVETSDPITCRSCLKRQAAADQLAARETGVRGTVRTAEGVQVRVYPGEDIADMLDTLTAVQQRAGLEVDAVAVSRTPGGDWEPVAPADAEPPAEGCAPWCAEHDDCTGGGRYPADPPNGTCWAPTLPTPGGRYGGDGSVCLTHDSEDGTLIQIITGHDTLLTVEEAERFAEAILAQTRLARTTVPASPAPMLLADVEGGCPNPGCRICKPADH
ncbi:hypothetical protein ACSDR0_43370 [Streptosporangium sp. G11]|uniref:hypothetical protein n=1 Tax=Streptosporangium sp. G11 TaxID=3436926 RepID=UPI003EB6E7DA